MKITDADLFNYLEVGNDDDLPDAAWWSAAEFAVRKFNEHNDTNFNPSDMVVAWIKQR